MGKEIFSKLPFCPHCLPYKHYELLNSARLKIATLFVFTDSFVHLLKTCFMFFDRTITFIVKELSKHLFICEKMFLGQKPFGFYVTLGYLNWFHDLYIFDVKKIS